MREKKHEQPWKWIAGDNPFDKKKKNLQSSSAHTNFQFNQNFSLISRHWNVNAFSFHSRCFHVDDDRKLKRRPTTRKLETEDKKEARHKIDIYSLCIPQASSSQMIFYKLSKNDSNLESTILGIHFPITQQHFVRGKLKVKCHG